LSGKEEVTLNFTLGLALSAIVGLVAYKKHWLNVSGIVGLLAVGTSLFVGGGWTWFAILIAFFASSSFLTLYKLEDKRFLDNIVAKPGARDIWQALANGGIGALSGWIYSFYPKNVIFAAFLGAIGTVTADTWAVEIGVLSKSDPILITTGKRVPPGTSGGISPLGTLATAAGALFIGLVTWALISIDSLFFSNESDSQWILPITLLAGIAGSIFDSFLGATVQSTYYCERCHKETERVVHTCGQETKLIKGWRWLGNDWVNFLSSLIGSLVAVLVYSTLYK
jgi:uncharacterized protein (TIGR00297 family)